MPIEKFYGANRFDGDGCEPDLTVSWGESTQSIHGSLDLADRAGMNRLIRSLRRARNQTFGKDE